ncbi:AAA family ATPase [Streptacidiphilus melanogenes]|uniref:AAA family ATPase n=1 Tax=Streptacidiphilus melanogenes TaxID=411235 RepID=UPI000A05DED7|nr:AAA family ATPase [Streptacidiphilus melanogenes]
MAAVTKQRAAELVLGLFTVLASRPEGMRSVEAIAETQRLLPPTDQELARDGKNTWNRYESTVGWQTSGPVKYGWLIKNNGHWTLTEEGRQVLRRYQSDLDGYMAEDDRLYKEYLASRPVAGGRAWLVRGSNVSGFDLVQRLWLPDGLVSLQASRLRNGASVETSKNSLRDWVEEDYGAATSYNQKQELVEALHTFLSRMRIGDTVCALSSGNLYLGEVVGDAVQAASPDGRSNLRRPVRWRDIAYPYDELPEEVQQKLSMQHDVVELTAVLDLLNALGLNPEQIEEVKAEAVEDPSVELPALPTRELDLPQPTQELADRLLIHNLNWLGEVRDLLWDERQIVFYGPPGTGKTFLAQEIAAFLGGGPEQVKLVQFHPAYAYEDFFEGFRPREDAVSGQVGFRLTAGPLRELADLASREGNRHVPYFLIIDELNRANLAKVFGELYFLLEYRNRSVRLTYSAEDFALPPNVFIIGTMNTADRSIALVDAAMRRRFAFVELSPREEPTSGLLRRWLEDKKYGSEPADLLDELNRRIADPDFRIGPSYLMKASVYRDADGLARTWRTKIIPLLEEHHYGEGVDIEARYGLTALRRGLHRATANANADSAADGTTGLAAGAFTDAVPPTPQADPDDDGAA